MRKRFITDKTATLDNKDLHVDLTESKIWFDSLTQNILILILSALFK